LGRTFFPPGEAYPFTKDPKIAHRPRGKSVVFNVGSNLLVTIFVARGLEGYLVPSSGRCLHSRSTLPMSLLLPIVLSLALGRVYASQSCQPSWISGGGDDCSQSSSLSTSAWVGLVFGIVGLLALFLFLTRLLARRRAARQYQESKDSVIDDLCTLPSYPTPIGNIVSGAMAVRQAMVDLRSHHPPTDPPSYEQPSADAIVSAPSLAVPAQAHTQDRPQYVLRFLSLPPLGRRSNAVLPGPG